MNLKKRNLRSYLTHSNINIFKEHKIKLFYIHKSIFYINQCRCILNFKAQRPPTALF